MPSPDIPDLGITYDTLKDEYRRMGKKTFIKTYGEQWYGFLQDILEEGERNENSRKDTKRKK